MKKVLFGCGLIGVAVLCFYLLSSKKEDLGLHSKIEGMVLSVEESTVMVQEKNHKILTFTIPEFQAKVGSYIQILYEGTLDLNHNIQDNKVIRYEVLKKEEQDQIPDAWRDQGIFRAYYDKAYQKMKTLTLDEKIGQILLVRYPDRQAKEALANYSFGGYLFFAKDFKNQSEIEVQTMIQELQEISSIPLLTAVDEEGGKVVRVSSNPKLVSERFLSSRELYLQGGFDLIRQDTIEKSKVLSYLGLNLNLAPVVDVSIDPEDYMYARALGEDSKLTAEYATTVISASKDTKVSYTLKHFPGYGNNVDTHQGQSVDPRSYEDLLKNDLKPFRSGVKAGAEAVLVSHNVVTSVDSNHPASLSPSIHNLLRNEVGFTGIIMTDALDMGAVSHLSNATVSALLAGNDLIITTDYEKSIQEIKTALKEEMISEDFISKLAFRILAWKYYKGLFQ